MIPLRTAFRAFAALTLCHLTSAPTSRAAEPAEPAVKSTVFNVRDHGAIGDGKVKDTAAFQKALDACAAAGNGTVLVPQGIYLTGSLQIKSNTTLRIENRAFIMGSADIADYPLARIRWEGEFEEGHRALIWAEKANNITIRGPGCILGPPISLSALRRPRAPALIEPSECTNVVLDGFTAQYQRMWAIHPVLCQNVAIRNLTVRSVYTNGDGIDVDSCRDVTIERCNIDAGDDAIALKSGRGLEAVRTGRPTENVLIKDCVLTSSMYAAIGIGTELSGDIRNVRIENCTLSAKANAIFIKSRDGRGATAENISGENLLIHNTANFLHVDLLGRGIQATEPVPGDVAKWTQVRNVRFTGIRVHKVQQLVNATKIPVERPLQGLVLSNITGDCEKGITIAHATDVAISDITVTGYQGPLITTEDVKGTGLTDFRYWGRGDAQVVGDVHFDKPPCRVIPDQYEKDQCVLSQTYECQFLHTFLGPERGFLSEVLSLSSSVLFVRCRSM